MTQYMEFEKPLAEIEGKAEELRAMARDSEDMDMTQEAAALSNFRQAMQGMGFGDSNEMKLNSGGGSVDFLTESDTTIAVLLEGSYAPGVQETLIIIAREIGKLA